MVIAEYLQVLGIVEVEIGDHVEVGFIEVHAPQDALTDAEGGRRRVGGPGVVHVLAGGLGIADQERRPAGGVGGAEPRGVHPRRHREAAGDALDHVHLGPGEAAVGIGPGALETGHIEAADIDVPHQAVGARAVLRHLTLQQGQLGRRHPAVGVLHQVLNDPGKPHTVAIAEAGGDHDAVVIVGVVKGRHGPHPAAPGAAQMIAVEFVLHSVIGPGDGLGGHRRDVGAPVAVVELGGRVVDGEVPHHALVAGVGTRHREALVEQLQGGAGVVAAEHVAGGGGGHEARRGAETDEVVTAVEALVRQHHGKFDPVGARVLGDDVAHHLAVGDGGIDGLDGIDHRVLGCDGADAVEGALLAGGDAARQGREGKGEG